MPPSPLAEQLPSTTPLLAARQTKFGRTDYNRFDHLTSVASIGRGVIGKKAEIDVKFLFKKSQWGVLGEKRNPGGIVYMDLNFHVPDGCRLKSATVRVKVDDTDPELRSLSRYFPGNVGSRNYAVDQPVQLSDWFGPKRLAGEARKQWKKKVKQLIPEVNLMGTGGGGLGTNFETATEQKCRWSFSGQILTGENTVRPSKTTPDSDSGSWMLYRTLEWNLSENKLESKAAHSNCFHTGFAFDHGGHPFFLVVEIEGKLMKGSVPRCFRFGRKPNGEENRAVTLVNFGGNFVSRDKILDQLARGLPEAMEEENYRSIPPELPDALPVNFNNVPPVPGRDSTSEGIEADTISQHLEGPPSHPLLQPLGENYEEDFSSGPSLDELASHALLAPPEPSSQPEKSLSERTQSTTSSSFHTSPENTLLGSDSSEPKLHAELEMQSPPSADLKRHFLALVYALYLASSGFLFVVWKSIVARQVFTMAEAPGEKGSASSTQNTQRIEGSNSAADLPPSSIGHRRLLMGRAGIGRMDNGDYYGVKRPLDRCMSF